MKKNRYFVLQIRSGNGFILKKDLTLAKIKREYPKAKPMFPSLEDW